MMLEMLIGSKKMLRIPRFTNQISYALDMYVLVTLSPNPLFFLFTIPGCLLNSIKLVNFSQTHPLFLLVYFNTLHGRHVLTIC